MNKNSKAEELAEATQLSTPGDTWLDNQDLLTRLHISTRTLQRWRTNRIIPFTRIGSKIYYKESDLRILLNGQ